MVRLNVAKDEKLTVDGNEFQITFIDLISPSYGSRRQVK